MSIKEKVKEKQSNLREEEIIPADIMDDYNEIDETNPETHDAFAAYLTEGTQKDREVRGSKGECRVSISRLSSAENLVWPSRRSRTASPWRVCGLCCLQSLTRGRCWIELSIVPY